MPLLGNACIALAIAALAVQITSCLMAMIRCRKARRTPAPLTRPPVSLVRPLCGVEHFSRETLASTFLIEYPCYEILFCVADPSDPVLPLARSVMADYPSCDVRILIGEDPISSNPKLNNMAKGFGEARFDHIVFVDSNVLTPADYLGQLVGTLQSGAGMVSAPPVGHAPIGFWAELECAFLNSYQARMQYAVDLMGLGFAQGKTLFFRRSDLEQGGFTRLAEEPAEDAAATKMMAAKGQRIRLAGPFPQLIGPRSASQVWKRHVRWARLRRASFPLLFAPEILAGCLPPLLVLSAGLFCFDILAPLALALFTSLWYLPELLLLRVAGWPRSLAAIMLRDLLLPFIFVAGCVGSTVEWHGKILTASSRGAQTNAIRPRLKNKLHWARFASRRTGN